MRCHSGANGVIEKKNKTKNLKKSLPAGITIGYFRKQQ
jgi:hypothetical protein